ncbi:hypothetical protein [Saccharopolyspora erythraea]|nr:hypothetical protein [Saccharopolyspora erythraea]QRK93436.1 hypothetical protein JQX30_10425 [Saccharopolyspora erythraea]
MRVTGYCYPWDVEDGFAERVAGLGVDEVAVAVSYHGARAATPWSARRSAVVARHAALYRPVRGEVWGRLRPAAPDWTGSEDSAGEAVAALRAGGVEVAAWLVLTHNSLLGTRFPDLAVRNCFDERYPWALCPAHEDVRDYAARLTAEGLAGRRSVLAEVGPGRRVVLHGSADPWATGALPGLTPEAASEVDSVVLQCWKPGEKSVNAVAAARTEFPSEVDVGAYVTAVAAQPVDMSDHVRGLGSAGASELHLYHLGLAGPARWSDLRAAVSRAHAAEPA